MQRFIVVLLVLIVILGVLWWSFVHEQDERDESQPDRVYIACTVQALTLMLRAIAPPERPVFTCAGPTDLAQTFTPTTKDLTRYQQTLAVIMVAPRLDSWAAQLPVESRLSVLSLLPVELRLAVADNSDRDDQNSLAQIDPYFWLDPQALATVLPPLADALSKIDPLYAEHYRKRAQEVAAEYAVFAEKMLAATAPLKGKALIQSHPSMAYLLRRLGMRNAGVVTARLDAGDESLLAVSVESQKPSAAAQQAAEQLGVPLIAVDPYGIQAKNMRQVWLDICNALLAAHHAQKNAVKP